MIILGLSGALNRRGEPLVCTPQDAFTLFVESDLHYLVMQDTLVSKTPEKATKA